MNGFGIESLLEGKTGEQSYNFGLGQFTNFNDLTVFHIIPVLGVLGFAIVFAYKVRKKFLPLNITEQKGDSRFSTLSEIQQAYKEVDQLETSFKGYGGIPVARYKDKLYLDDQTVNTVIIGTSRSGKGETFVFPTIDVTSRAEDQSSLVINDPKGELYTGSYETLRKRGYDIEVINMISPEDSLSYNPLALIIEAYTNGDMEKAQQLTESLTFSLYMTGDPEADFWNSLASSLVGASILALCGIYLKEDKYQPEKITMRNVQTFITELGKQKVKINPDDKEEKTKLDLFFHTLDNSDVAKMLYSATLFAEGKTRSSIFVSALEKLKLFNADSMARMTSKNSIDFSLVGFPKQIRLFTDYKLVGESIKAEFYKKGTDKPFGEDVGQVKRLIKNKEAYGSLKICFDEELSDGDIIHLKDNGNIDLWYSFKRIAKNALSPVNEYGLVEYRDKASTNIIKNKEQKGLELVQSMETYYIDKPKAIFLLVPDYDRSRAMLSSIFIKQMYQTLATMCQDVRGNKLHRRLKFLLDEFGNMTPIKEMDSIMTVCLGRNILFDLVVQGYNQITALYGDEKGQSIKDNCQNHLYILSTSSTTTKEISEKLGYRTIELKGNSGDSTELEQKNSKSVDRQPLIEPFNLLRFEEGEMLVLRSLKRQTNKKEKVKAYPIYNTG
ncbi:MAG: type IV secretory system conjugative DNA transfer family protein, partial [Carnobacterium sp.]